MGLESGPSHVKSPSKAGQLVAELLLLDGMIWHGGTGGCHASG
jgi:hypothetical protein